MNNNGLSSANFISGAMDGYKFMQGIDDHKREVGRQGLRDQQDAENHTARMESNKQNQAINSMQMRQMEKAEADSMERDFWAESAALDGVLSLSEKQKADMLARKGGSRAIRPDYLMSQDVGDSINTFEAVRVGDVDMNSPEAIKAANVLFNVNRGAKDGRSVSISRLVPSNDGGGLHFALDSKEADGTEVKGVPLTDGRSSRPDDTVSTISIDEIDNYIGTVKQMRGALMNPEYKQAMYRRHGLISEKDFEAAKYNKESGMYEQTNRRTGETKFTRDGVNDSANGGGRDSRTANEKDIKFLVAQGVSQEDAIDRVYNNGESPAKEIRVLTSQLLKESKDRMDEKPLTLEEAGKQAREVYFASMSQTRRAPPVPAPSSNVPDVLRTPQSQPQQAGDLMRTSQSPVAQGMPDAAQHAGRTGTDSATGRRYTSNGKEWVEIK